MQLRPSSSSFISDAFLSQNLSYVNQFFDKVDKLKSEGNWPKILILGEQALKDKLISRDQLASLLSQLASASFYLGEYELCESYTQQAFEVGQELQDTRQLLKCCCLLSAHKRALACKADQEEQKRQLFLEARSYILQGFTYYSRCEDSPTKGKLLFNAGASHLDDPMGDLKIAADSFENALQVFDCEKDYDDYSRTLLRLAQVELKQNEHKKCQKTLEQISFEALHPKTQVHFLILKARCLDALSQYSKAAPVILDALELATKMEMKPDINRLNELLFSIKSKEAEINPLMHLKC